MRFFTTFLLSAVSMTVTAQTTTSSNNINNSTTKPPPDIVFIVPDRSTPYPNGLHNGILTSAYNRADISVEVVEYGNYVQSLSLEALNAAIDTPTDMQPKVYCIWPMDVESKRLVGMNSGSTKEYYEIRGDKSSSLWSCNVGKITIAFAARTMNRHLDHTRVSYQVDWHTSKGSAHKQVDASLVYVVSKAITNSGFYEKFEVCAYTSLTIRNRPKRVEEHESIADDGTIYRAEGSTIGGRNDWCMIAAQQLGTDESTAQGFNKWHHTCPRQDTWVCPICNAWYTNPDVAPRELHRNN